MLRLSRLWLWLLAWLSVQAVQAVRLQDTREYQDCVASVATCDALTLTNQLLTGTIPPGVFTFTNLFALNLNSNRLTGTLSTEFGALTNLRSLLLSQNRLDGTIPTQMGELTALIIWQTHSNRLDGTLPAELSLLTQLRILDVRNCEHSGSIPSVLAELESLQEFLYTGNSLCGAIPADLQGVQSELPLCQPPPPTRPSFPPAIPPPLHGTTRNTIPPSPEVVVAASSGGGMDWGSLSSILYIIATVVGLLFVGVVGHELWKYRQLRLREEHRMDDPEVGKRRAREEEDDGAYVGVFEEAANPKSWLPQSLTRPKPKARRGRRMPHQPAKQFHSTLGSVVEEGSASGSNRSRSNSSGSASDTNRSARSSQRGEGSSTAAASQPSPLGSGQPAARWVVPRVKPPSPMRAKNSSSGSPGGSSSSGSPSEKGGRERESGAAEPGKERRGSEKRFVWNRPDQEAEQPKERHERPTRPPSTFVWKSKAQAEDEEAGYDGWSGGRGDGDAGVAGRDREFGEEEEEGFSHDDEEDEAYDGHEQVAADAEYHRREQEVVYNRREQEEEEQEEEGFSHDEEEDEAYDGHEQVAADAEHDRREQEKRASNDRREQEEEEAGYFWGPVSGQSLKSRPTSSHSSHSRTSSEESAAGQVGGSADMDEAADARKALTPDDVPVSIMEEEPPPAAPTRPSWFTNLPRQSVPSLSRPPPRASVVVQPATRSRRTSEEDEGPVPARSTSVGESAGPPKPRSFLLPDWKNAAPAPPAAAPQQQPTRTALLPPPTAREAVAAVRKAVTQPGRVPLPLLSPRERMFRLAALAAPRPTPLAAPAASADAASEPTRPRSNLKQNSGWKR